MSDITSVLVLGYDGAGEQDLLAPWELFRSLAWSMNERGEQLHVVLGSLHGGSITTHMGATVGVDWVTTHDRFDVLYVPGGAGAGSIAGDAKVLKFVKDHHAAGAWVVANCAGVGILHRAGVLEGVDITAPATLSRRLAAEGAAVTTPRRAWLISPDRRIATTGGAATVHPSTIALVSHLFGDDAGRGLAADWDTHPLHGESLFSLAGPEMDDDPIVRAAVQDRWEDALLPVLAVA